MSRDPVKQAHRRHWRRQRLGPDARCLLCGESNPEALLRVDRTWFEIHHVLGAAHDPNVTCVVCLNCHALFSAGQFDDGVPLKPQATVLERVLAVVAALGSFLRLLAEALLAWAERGLGVVAGLDRDYPDWRTRSWAV